MSAEDEGTVIIANNQTKGKGRVGREWISSKDKDILFSIILKPGFGPKEMQGIVFIAAVAVNMALRDIGISSQIKWPNDIVIEGKKICGILLELCSIGQSTNYAILGIGINANEDIQNIPKELKDKYMSLKIVKGEEIDKDILLNNLLRRFKHYYINYKETMDMGGIIKIYKENSAVLGRDILVIQGKETPRVGKAIDVKATGELVVDFPNGIEEISYGEVSIRATHGYI